MVSVVRYNRAVDNATALPAGDPMLPMVLREQPEVIDSSNTNFQRLAKWQLEPKTKAIDVDQFGLLHLADESLVIETLAPREGETEGASAKRQAKREP